MADDQKKTESSSAPAQASPSPSESRPAQQAATATESTTPPTDAQKPSEQPQEAAETGKLSFLTKLRKITDKSSDKDIPSQFDRNSDGYISAREAINALDKEIQVSMPSEDEVAAQVREQLEEQAEYYVIRVRKSGFMLVAGLTLLFVWLILLTFYWQRKGTVDWKSFIPGFAYVTTPSPSPEAALPTVSPTASTVKIRVKTAEGDNRLERVTTLLKDNGYSEVDIETVTEIMERGVLVAVKQDRAELLGKLLTLLQAEYAATSSASTLSADSDFDGVIWLGKN